MLLHKLHLQDWLHTLENLGWSLKKIENGHYSAYADREYYENIINKLKEFEKYLEKVTTHLLEETSELHTLKKAMLQLEGENLDKTKDWLNEIIPTLHRSLHESFIIIKQLIGSMERMKKTFGKKTVDHVKETEMLAENLRGRLQSVFDISKSIAGKLDREFAAVKKESEILVKEKDVLTHLRHNMNSWFLH